MHHHHAQHQHNTSQHKTCRKTPNAIELQEKGQSSPTQDPVGDQYIVQPPMRAGNGMLVWVQQPQQGRTFGMNPGNLP